MLVSMELARSPISVERGYSVQVWTNRSLQKPFLFLDRYWTTV